MDLQEWELLDGIDNGDPDCEGSFLQVNNNQLRIRGDGGNSSNVHPSCRRINHHPHPYPHHEYCSITGGTTALVHMNYFICPPSPSPPHQLLHKTTRRLLSLPLPLHLESAAATATSLDCPHIAAVSTTIAPPNQEEINLKSLATQTQTNTGPDPVSQVFFKKMMKETDQFVDMNMNMNMIKAESSPTRSNATAAAAAAAASGINTSSEARTIAAEDAANFPPAKGDSIPNPNVKDLEYRRNIGSVEGDGEGEGEGGGLSPSKLNIFQWSFSGMAAVVATVCIIVFSNRDRERRHPRGPLNEIMFRFQICANYDHKHGRMRMRMRRRRKRSMKQQGLGEGEKEGGQA